MNVYSLFYVSHITASFIYFKKMQSSDEIYEWKRQKREVLNLPCMIPKMTP